MSTRVRGVPSTSAPPAAPTAAVLPPYRTFTKLNHAPFLSVGHAHGRWDVDVYANELGRAALAARSHDVPVGAIVVQEHHERGATDHAGPVMLMEKRAKGYAPEHGDWRYLVVGSKGQTVKDGPAFECASCHDDSPMDGLFPIP